MATNPDPNLPDVHPPETSRPEAPAQTGWAGIAALVACAALWSLNGPLIKLVNESGEGLPGIAIAAYRSVLGGLVFLPLAFPRRQSLRNASLPWLIGSVGCFTLMTGAFVIANTMTTASNAIVLQYTAPIWVVALSPLLLAERPRWSESAALLVCMAGVAVIFAWQPRGDLAGLLVALTSGFGYGTLIVALRGLRRVDPVVVVTMNCVGSGLILLIAVGLTVGFAISARQLVLVLVLGVVQFALPYLLFSWALQRVEAYRASLITLLEMILNPVLTMLIVGERVPAATLVGGPLVLLGVALWLTLTWHGARRQRRRPAAPAG